MSNRARLNVADVDLGIVERLLTGFSDQMPDGFAFLFQVALKIGAPAADNINWLAHEIKIRDVRSATNVGGASVPRPTIIGTLRSLPHYSATESIHRGDVLTNYQS